MDTDIKSTNAVVKAVITGEAPRPARLAAARGMLPLPQGDLLEILVHLASGGDEELSHAAKGTLDAQDTSVLHTVASSVESAPAVLAFLAEKSNLPSEVHEKVITNPHTPGEALINLANRTREGTLLELIALNQQRLIEFPALIEALIGNTASPPEAQRRASETKREFFEKERGAQQIASELRAQGKEAAAEFIEAAEFAENLRETAGENELSLEDAILLADLIEVPDVDVDDSWLSLDLIEEIYEESPEQRAAIVDKIVGELGAEGDEITLGRVNLIRKILLMSMKDRIKYAMKGDRQVRNILIRDPNRIVSEAVIKNPKITDQEIEKIATMRTISGDILRQIAINRQWARVYSISLYLAKNPRTPISNVMSILTRLQSRDLKSISENRNVSDAVRQQALRLYATRRQ
jgi:hypothetical protein